MVPIGIAFALLCFGVACGGSIDDRLVEVQALHDAGEFSSSIEALRSILASSPDHPQANYLLGVALVQTRQPSLAVWPLRKATEDENFAVTSGLLLASTLVQMEGFEEAVRVTDGVLKREPQNLLAMQLRAQANLEAGLHEDALQDASHVLEIEPDGHQGLALQAMAFTKLGRFDDAEQAILKLNEIAKESEDPQVAVQSCVALAVFYRDHGPEKADPVVRDCLERFPGEPFVLKEASVYYDGVERSEEATALWHAAVEQAPDNMGLRVLLAERLQNQGNVGEAEMVLVETAELFQDPGAWNQLARFYAARGELEKAEDATEKAIAGTQGDTQDLLFRKADLLIQNGKVEEAEAIAEELDEVVYRELIRARILIAREQHREALDVLESALSRWPNNAGARYLAGQAAENIGDIKKALSHYRESVRVDKEATDAALEVARLMLSDGRYGDAQALAEMHLTARPTRIAEAHTLAARAASARGRYAIARNALTPLMKTEHKLAAVVELAGVERAEKGAQAALSLVETSGLDLSDAENSPALRSAVEDEVALERYDSAIKRVQLALAGSPDSADLHDLLGRVYSRAGRNEEARGEFRAALAADPDSASSRGALARLEIGAGDPDAALALLDEGLDDPDNGHLAAQIVLSRGDKRDAEARLRRVLAKSPGHAFACNDLAWLLAEENKDMDFALEIASRAARVSPLPEILDTLGWVQYRRGDAAAAAATFERAVEAQPDSSPVQYRLGLALRDLNRSDDALAAFRKAVNGSGAEAQAAESEIAKLEATR